MPSPRKRSSPTSTAGLISKIEDLWREVRKRGDAPELTGSTTETGVSTLPLSVGGQSLGSWYYALLAMENDRKARYQDYAQILDDMPEVDAALDALVDAALQNDQRSSGESQAGYRVTVVSPNGAAAQQAIDEAEEACGIQENISGIAHDVLLYGDDTCEIIVMPDRGVVGLAYLPPESIRIQRDSRGKVDTEFPYVQVDSAGNALVRFRDWQILHFANRRDRRTLYGRSHLASCRVPITQLRLMEDATVLGWIHRSVIKYVWFLDVTNMTPEAATTLVNKVKLARAKHQTVDPASGKFRAEANPLSGDDEIFLPKGGSQSATDIKVLQGDPNLRFAGQGMSHFFNKVFAGLRVPKGIVGFAEDISAKAVLSEQQVQMGRTARRLQLDLLGVLKKFHRICLLARGIDPSKVKLKYTFPFMGTMDETVRANLQFTRVQIATMVGQILPPELLASRVLGPALDLPEEDIVILSQYLKEHPVEPDSPAPPNGVKSTTSSAPSSDRPQSTGRSGSQQGRARGLNPGHEADYDRVVAALKNDPQIGPMLERLGFMLRWKNASLQGDVVSLASPEDNKDQADSDTDN